MSMGISVTISLVTNSTLCIIYTITHTVFMINETKTVSTEKSLYEQINFLA